MLKVLYFNTGDLRNEIQEHYDEDALKKFIQESAEEWIGTSRDDPEWEETIAMKDNSGILGSKDVYYEKHFYHDHVWIVL